MADAYAGGWANRLLGNARDCALIEVVLGGITLQVMNPCTIAVCGAEVTVLVNKRTCGLWRSVSLEAGDKVQLTMSKHGVYVYIALRGGVVSEQFMGSASVNPRENIGRYLQQGDEVAGYAQATLPVFQYQTQLAARYLPNYQTALTLHLYPCYQFADFSQTAIDQLLRQPFYIDNASNKMGIKLIGKVAINAPYQQLLSEGLAYGSVQVLPSGALLVLLSDRPSIGGYPKLGVIRYKDCQQLVQRQVGQRISFALGRRM